MLFGILDYVKEFEIIGKSRPMKRGEEQVEFAEALDYFGLKYNIIDYDGGPILDKKHPFKSNNPNFDYRDYVIFTRCGEYK